MRCSAIAAEPEIAADPAPRLSGVGGCRRRQGYGGHRCRRNKEEMDPWVCGREHGRALPWKGTGGQTEGAERAMAIRRSGVTLQCRSAGNGEWPG